PRSRSFYSRALGRPTPGPLGGRACRALLLPRGAPLDVVDMWFSAAGIAEFPRWRSATGRARLECDRRCPGGIRPNMGFAIRPKKAKYLSVRILPIRKGE